MAYPATVIPVMIASPGDVLNERASAREIIHGWNYVNATSRKVVLMPVGWESHSSPDLAGRPQAILNEKVLRDCDLLVGIFWTRLGSPTGGFESGSVEEIKRHLGAGKPAMIYFSNAPVVLDSVDRDQYDALQAFKTWCKGEGLIETYDSIIEFEAKFSRQLQVHLNTHAHLLSLMQIANPDRQANASFAAEARPATSEPVPSLSEEAKELLRTAAADASGIIMRREHMGGTVFRAGNRSFAETQDRRTIARWDHAMEQLRNSNLIEPNGPEGLYALTQRGYEVADKLG